MGHAAADDLTLTVTPDIKGMGARKKLIVHIQTLGISPLCSRLANTCHRKWDLKAPLAA